MKLVGGFVVVAITFAPTAWADNYEVSVTRKGSNLYKIDGRDVLIHTRYCYEYAYSEDSFLRMSGYSGEIVFLDAGEKCDVKAVYGVIAQSSGNYSVTVTREEDDWYEVQGQDVWLKTSGCYAYSYGEESVLKVSGYGGGTLYVNDSTCTVEGIYGRLRL